MLSSESKLANRLSNNWSLLGRLFIPQLFQLGGEFRSAFEFIYPIFYQPYRANIFRYFLFDLNDDHI